jgi:toxin FitB
VTWLLDTNVVSELRKAKAGKANPGVVKWAIAADRAQLFISAVTVHELELGVLLVSRRDKRQGKMLRTWLDQSVLRAFEGRVLPIDVSVALRGASLHVPNPQPFRDGLITATAMVHGLTVVTRNVGDFQFPGLPVLNPWEG